VIPDKDLAKIRRWLEAKNEANPEHVRDQLLVDLDVTDRFVTIVECRPPWSEDMGPEWTRQPVARLRYTKVRNEWSLYWSDRNEEFHQYDLVHPTRHVERLLAEVDRDPTAIFWG